MIRASVLLGLLTLLVPVPGVQPVAARSGRQLLVDQVGSHISEEPDAPIPSTSL